jgi:hypothetical protein
MLKIHHLRIGRSIFMVWLMEELELEYEVVEYLRDAETMLAPPELKKIHPLGKSPVIDDDGLIISVSGAITSYLLEKHDMGNKFSPPRSDLAAGCSASPTHRAGGAGAGSGELIAGLYRLPNSTQSRVLRDRGSETMMPASEIVMSAPSIISARRIGIQQLEPF